MTPTRLLKNGLKMRKANPFKGLHRVRRKTKAGVVTHCYAWRGGPALEDSEGIPLKEGSPEFARAFLDARASRSIQTAGTLATLISEYRASSEYPANHHSKRNYGAALRKIEDAFGTMPIVALEARGARGVFMRWRDTMAATPRTADYAWMVLARVLSVAKDRGRIVTNPCERGGRLYEADRTERLWTEADIGKLLSVASPEVRAAVLFALWTGQRQGDLLALPWSAFDGERIRLCQSKTGRRVTIRVSRELASAIAALPRVSPVMLTSSEGRPWTGDGFRTSFARACRRAGIENLTFHDFRGTAITRLALDGATALEIAAIVGLSERAVSNLLDRHYLGDRDKLAEAAIIRLEKRTRPVNHV